ncbi:hypothetical protein NEFER03_0147 [Nematocida sp. LUAm3]|nr:hypothetical protein NEFER03_0147 [Nematocida sp. LUAm3]KAI5173600.1 hypothetical protein NEFER02_0116 [Nematocida sp. LUAm2]KAI5176821.1 hypothetical protein NEFER01_0146 [Nematocida sp. LUAm1]
MEKKQKVSSGCGMNRKPQRKVTSSGHCICCNEVPHLVLAQSVFCKKCFITKMQKIFLSEVRKALENTLRNKMRMVLVFLDNSLSSRIIYHMINTVSSGMIKYIYCSVEEIIWVEEEVIRLEEKTKSVPDIVECVSKYAQEQAYDLVLFGWHSVEVAKTIIEILISGEIQKYGEIFVYNRVPICYPFYSTSYKSSIYYGVFNGLINEKIKRSNIANERDVHNRLLRGLLKESPGSILNLIKTQEKVFLKQHVK